MMYKKLILGTALGLVMFVGDSLAEVTGSCGNTCTYTMDDEGNVVIEGTGTLGALQGVDKADIKTVVIRKGITKIGGYVFRNSALTSIKIPDSVVSIDTHALTAPLKSLVLPDSVTNVGIRAFSLSGIKELFCSEAKVESGECAAFASSSAGNIPSAKIGYYEDDAFNDERVLYLQDENGVWKETGRESIYEKHVSDTGAVFLLDFEGNIKKMKGKKIYTVEEAEEATKNGDKFHVGLTYK